MAAQPKPQLKSPAEVTITKGAMSPNKAPIDNHGMVQFHVKGFENKKYCNLLIYAVTYTDDGITDVTAAESMPGPVLLGTIKIGS